MAFYGEEYREELAKRKGFKSYKDYSNFLAIKRKEKIEKWRKSTKEIIEHWRKSSEEFEIEFEKKLREKEKSKTLSEMSEEERLKYFEEHKACESLQRIVSETKDEESIFKDIEFIEKFTGCKIKKRVKKK